MKENVEIEKKNGAKNIHKFNQESCPLKAIQ